VRFVSWDKHQATAAEETMIPPWPMLFHANARELAERFDIRVSQRQHLAAWEFTPRHQGDWGRFRLMRVLFETTTGLPNAVQFINRAGDVEAVYTLEYTQVQRHKPTGIEPNVLPLKPDAPKLEPAPTNLHGLP
jgi:hypothetical protein